MRLPTAFEAVAGGAVFAALLASLAGALALGAHADSYAYGAVGFGWLVGASTVVTIWALAGDLPAALYDFRHGGDRP